LEKKNDQLLTKWLDEPEVKKKSASEGKTVNERGARRFSKIFADAGKGWRNIRLSQQKKVYSVVESVREGEAS